MYIFIYTQTGATLSLVVSSQLWLENTPTASLQRGKTPPTRYVLDMTLKNLMVRFQ